MKKIFSNTVLLLAGVFALSSCEKDLDSNPTLVNPTTFTLNTPAVSSNIELENTNSITLTWSQPQFTEPNAPVAANYLVQFSPTGSFNKRFDPNAEENPGADYFQFDKTPERYKQMEIREFRHELGRIRDIANTISANMTRALDTRQKEQAPRSAGEAR